MKLATYTNNGITRIGAITDNGLVDLNSADASLPVDMLTLLEGGDEMMATAREAISRAETTTALSDIKLACPLPNPPRIFAVALNYMDHFYEVPESVRDAHKIKPPEIPVIFNKQTTSANGPYDPVDLPEESSQLDYEGELAVVIGKTCRRVPQDRAFEVIAGYTVLNDVTIRDWQLATPTMTMGKSWDSHCPMGPVIVTSDEIPEPENLRVTTSVDGEVRQSFNTKDMIFGIAKQIQHISTAITLLPGDIIATGTSAGVALFRDGQPFLKEGQKVKVEIEKIGYIENPVAREKEPTFIR
jgi:2-keto-4-pentenoate hydratase/2-oxohepta-3-ene-1,7-dioic acid hydratase in catechol pathway